MEKRITHKNTYIVAPDATKNVRLDVYLAGRLTGYSRSSILNLIDEGYVTINEKVAVKGGYALKQGDNLSVCLPAQDYSFLEKNKPQKLELSIVAEHEDFLIINKPAGLLVHHAPTSKETVSVVNGLLYHYQSFSEFNDTVRPGIVHRLDKNTSGLLLIAKNPQAQRDLSEQFKDRHMHKTYLAVVEGHMDQAGDVSFAIGRHPTKRHMMSHKGINARQAHTGYTVLRYYKDSSLVAFKPVTGRTHQIRVHATSIGHPIIGDDVYGQKSKEISRQALHAWKLQFSYKGKEYSYHAPVPEDMKKLLLAMRNG